MIGIDTLIVGRLRDIVFDCVFSGNALSSPEIRKKLHGEFPSSKDRVDTLMKTHLPTPPAPGTEGE